MSLMTVENSHVGKMLVSPHAQERWRERAVGPLAESLKRAIPFGGQYGDNLLLIDEEIVFACEKYGRAHLVKTVLTKDQAVANMEFAAGGYQMYKDGSDRKRAKFEIKPPYEGGVVALAIPQPEVLFERHTREPSKSKEPSKRKNPTHEEAFTIAEILKLMKMTNNQLAEAKDVHGGGWHDFIQSEQKRRKHFKSQIDQLKEDASSRKAMCMAILEMVEPEIAEKIFARAKEISDNSSKS